MLGARRPGFGTLYRDVGMGFECFRYETKCAHQELTQRGSERLIVAGIDIKEPPAENPARIEKKAVP